MSLTFFALTGSALTGLGIYGLMSQPHLLRRVIAFNIIGSGLFLFFGAAGARGAAADPIPQALIITGIVVALSASALAVALVVALARSTGQATLPGSAGDGPGQEGPKDEGRQKPGPEDQGPEDQGSEQTVLQAAGHDDTLQSIAGTRP
ncbi:NADH-quinone oxidoreductase subunit K [Roseicitreum antarcticum]|uniref:Multicomponent Na+:H+ antiporter subunit C n=1 Tax=Roseicitreum antarcticum TaxID=564137 RepID=A0A1H3D5Z9_9RHOB|nr:NADH-quinone oxidoreductase subunit K [Roseicitreum antarcticum]SDX61831.1 multicomponent Na+:H+ antiporter subunit C [Roseicitreum antarcticum]